MNATLESINNIDKPISIYSENIEQSALEQFSEAMQLSCNIAGALMPDAHSGYTLPIGAVVKTTGFIFPAYVGYDIGCGMCAAKLNIKHTKDNPLKLDEIKDLILKKIPLGFKTHKRPQTYRLTECSDVAKKAFHQAGRFQIGSLGGGNHFIEVGVDSKNFVWIVVHSGSRGFGKKIAEHYMDKAVRQHFDRVEALKLAKQFDDENEAFFEECKDAPQRYENAKIKFLQKNRAEFARNHAEGHFALELDSELGQAYLKDLDCALEFALENRKRMVSAILDSINEVCGGGVEMIEFINKNHNHAIILQDGNVLHRKGATNANDGEMGVIPGNMRDGSFIVRGKGCEASLCSSSHGAGRVLSRSQAKQMLDIDEFHKQMEGIVTNHTERNIDEAPKAYKNIFDVMSEQKEMVEVIEHIRPVLNLKG